MYKYKIHYYLQQLSHEDYQISWKFFPEALKISPGTWKSWIYIKEGDGRNIPSDKLPVIASFFQISVEELFSKKKKCLQTDFNFFKKKKHV
ncbi:MAG: hypothetical protein M9897_06360 [Brumimicrobium sp.]|nr:hypothetical protein [Brumimicrobium sp.]